MSANNTVSVGGIAGVSTNFWARKFHSLTGIVPVGLFLLEHFFTNSYAVSGPAAFNKAVEGLRSLPYVVFIEIGMIGIPILYHSLYGVWISFQGRPNNLRFNFTRNWLYLTQRLTGAFLVVYIVLHVAETRIAMTVDQIPMDFDFMARKLSNPATFLFYSAGVVTACLHFANGIWSFLIGWGVTTSEAAMKRSAWICGIIGLLMSVAGVNALLGFLGKGFSLNI